MDVFAGQPYLTPSYRIDSGRSMDQTAMEGLDDFTGWRNEPIVPGLSDAVILEHIQKIQRGCQIEPSARLEGRCNLTIEMETGVGKTYTYIKTMFELNKHYGWSKFIVVVPSIDHFVVTFQYRDDAEKFYEALKRRMGHFGLKLEEEKSRLIEFGRFAAENRRKAGKEPDAEKPHVRFC